MPQRPVAGVDHTTPGRPAAAPATTHTTPASEFPTADDPLPTLIVSTPPETRNETAPQRLDVVLTVLHVQVPRAALPQTQTLWSHLREDLFDGATALRLWENGFRVGIGNAEWWDAVHAALDAIDGVQSASPAPVRVPPNFPLAFELDAEPHEQTLFWVPDDGVLTGETWPQSRNVLRVSYELDLQDLERIRLAVVPEVRQNLGGFEWVRREAGLIQQPKFNGRAFGAAGFRADLEPGEFLLVAPNERADVYGLLGRAFLACEQDGQRYDSYVFLRADVNHVAQRN